MSSNHAGLVEATNYRDFLALAFGRLREQNPRYNHSVFAKSAGFASRNYLRDILAGRKRLTLSALPRICRGLQLSGEWRKLLELLAALEEAEFNTTGASAGELGAKVARMRSRLRKKVMEGSGAEAKAFFSGPHWLPIYAATGAVGQGATLAEIRARTGLSEAACRNALRGMVAHNVVAYRAEADRYLPGELHYVFNQLGKDEFFKRSFLQSQKRGARAAQMRFDRQDSLFFTSTFSVDRARLPEFRTELRRLLHQFVSKSETAEGNSVAEMAVSFLPFAGGEA